INMPAPKLFTRFPDESNFRIGGTVEPAQLSYWNGEAPGGVSGFAPHRSATQTDSPSLSIVTAFSAPHILPSGSLPQGSGSLVRVGEIIGRLGFILRVCSATAQC